MTRAVQNEVFSPPDRRVDATLAHERRCVTMTLPKQARSQDTTLVSKATVHLDF
jgi:hypothetical protein